MNNIEQKEENLSFNRSLSIKKSFNLSNIFPPSTENIVTYHEVAWEDKSNVRKHSIRMYGMNNLGGIPTSFDYNVFIVLYKIMIKNNSYNYEMNNDVSQHESPNKVYFTFSEIGEHLGWEIDKQNGICDIKMQQIKESLRRLSSVSIFYIVEDEKSEMMNQINLIHHLDYYEKDLSDKKSSCEIGEYLLILLKKCDIKDIAMKMK